MKKRKLNKCLFLNLLPILFLISSCADGTTNIPDDSSKDNDDSTSTTLNISNPTLKNVSIPSEVDYSLTESKILNASSYDFSELEENDELSDDYTSLTSDGIISSEGNYLLSGDYLNGITFNLKKDSTVHLFLDNANINVEEGSAFIKSDKKINVIITALKGTTNYISNKDDSNTLAIKGNLSINGSGIINVSNENNDSNAIKVSKTLVIADTTLNVISYKNGISAESIYAKDATFNIQSEKDGIKAECDFDNSDGTTYEYTLESGFVNLVDCSYTAFTKGDAIQADSYLYIDDGNYDITTQGEFVNYSDSNKEAYDLEDDDYKFIKSGDDYIRIAKDSREYSYSQRYALTQSVKGFKVGEIKYDTDGDDEEDTTITTGDYSILITSGTFSFDTDDDAIHANSGNTYINGGNYSIDSKDDAITSDLFTVINDGDINITSAYEGLEGTYVVFNNGDISMDVTDDGLNATTEDNSITPYIMINDGTLDINADGDALDSNGVMVINGGSIALYGTQNPEDTLLDTDYGFIINGGEIIGTTSKGMIEMPGSNSTNQTIFYYPDSAIEENAKVEIKDESGNIVYSQYTKSSDEVAVISTSKIELNTKYYLYINDTLIGDFTPAQKAIALGNYSQSGNEPGGNQPGGQPGQGGQEPGQDGNQPGQGEKPGDNSQQPGGNSETPPTKPED